MKGQQMTEMTPAPQGQALTTDQRIQAEWDAANAQADEVIGYTLIGGKLNADNDKAMSALVGVPFLIEGVTFRLGDVKQAKTGTFRDYVSVEALIHPAHQFKFPRNRIVFNDGSTGVYRDVVKYLAARGYVTVNEELPENGEAGNTRYDCSFSTDESPAVSFSIALRCPEGLRVSDYVNDYTQDGHTYYLA
jgi:hypothetical protein